MLRLLVLTIADDGAVSQRGSLPPFEHVVELHGPAVLRFCVAQVGPARAEDCFQDTMLS
jgi:DNA-directed RNA polymerase specialized sigma24 family protein